MTWNGVSNVLRGTTWRLLSVSLFKKYFITFIYTTCNNQQEKKDLLIKFIFSSNKIWLFYKYFCSLKFADEKKNLPLAKLSPGENFCCCCVGLISLNLE